jgi:ATP-dependent Lon protease
MNRSFLNHIMNHTSEVPSLHQLIKRVEALTSHEPLKSSAGNELLRSMLVAINSYSAKNKDEQLVANITSAAVLSVIYRNKAAQQTNIVVDLQGFLQQSISRIEQASEALNELKRDIEANNAEMNENIDKVIAEIGELKEKNYANRDAFNPQEERASRKSGKTKNAWNFQNFHLSVHNDCNLC